MKCKNCGHEIEKFGEEYGHILGPSTLSVVCPIVIDKINVKSRRRKNPQLFNPLTKDISCKCDKPEPENQEEKSIWLRCRENLLR